MTKATFRISLVLVLTTMLALLIAIGKQSTPQALPYRSPYQTAQFDRNTLAVEMIDKINDRANRMYELCSYVGGVALKLGMETRMPLSKCEGVRAEQNNAIARINRLALNGNDEDLRTASRGVDRFLIETAPMLRTMEESYAIAKRVMDQAGMQ